MQVLRAPRQFMIQVVVPAGAAMIAVAAILALLFSWSTREVDRAAMERQSGLLALVMRESVAGLAHDQEASTVWDDAVLQVRRRPLDLTWLDANLGIWFNTYYGHDQTYILDAGDRPLYAMQAGRRADPTSFAALRPAAAPLLRRLRAMLRQPDAPLAPATLSPGTADLALIGGRPAIISVKPIVSDSGRYPQAPGAEYLHVSIRFLDGSFITRLSRRYGFDAAHFVAVGAPASVAMLPLRNRAGVVIGSLAWTPFAPGTRVLGQLGPALVAALLLVAGIVALLMRRIRRSVVQLHASRAEVHHLAYHDVLTGLPNRALFDDRLQHALARLRRDGTGMLALLYLDLDRLKHVNDTLGHPAGDAVITELGRRLRGLLRETDTIARLGGDEFAIIQSDVRVPGDIDILCLRIVEAIARPFDVPGAQVHVGISIGVALAPADGLDPIELSRKADIALYQSKARGRGRYTMFRAEMDSTIQERQAITRDLRAALAAGDQFSVHYQPLYAVPSGRVAGLEALVRWQRPRHGAVSPAVFIPIAEESGLIEAIGDWVLRRACVDARGWRVDKISVNISAVQLRNPAFAGRVRAIVAETGLDPHRLELEITETCFIENTAEIQPNIIALRAAGVQIALDDFGTGYSSLSHLREFDVDRVKIDRSFVDAIDPGTGGSAIIQAIVDLAQATGLSVTAEGVETAEQGDFLAGIGCDELQGFLLSRPLPADQIGALLDRVPA